MMYSLCRPVSCILCPLQDGAFKKTDIRGEWVHVFCALWHPQISLHDATTAALVPASHLAATLGRSRGASPSSRGASPSAAAVAPLSALPAQPAASSGCDVCGSTRGYIARCAAPGCQRSFHQLCAWYEGNFVRVRDSPGSSTPLLLLLTADCRLPTAAADCCCC